MERTKATPDNINNAVAITGLSSYISKMPMGFNTIVDPEGKKIPRNVQNRILLARAIATNPRLIILEDPLDHVNQDEKRKIIELLTSSKNRWNIIVSSVDNIWTEYVQEIIQLENGELK